ncbi:MAG: outer membrane protein assembly factor BamE [Chitinispirillaceae bacterium]
MRLPVLAVFLIMLSCQKGKNGSEEKATEMELNTYSIELENGGYLGSDGSQENYSKVTAYVKKKELLQKDTVFHGPFKAYIEYPCGEEKENTSALRVEGSFQNGQKHGEWSNYFYPCSPALDTSEIEVHISGRYDSGKRTGEWITARRGQGLEIQHYTEGTLDSTGISQVAMKKDSPQIQKGNSAGLKLELFRSRLPENATIKDVVKLLGTPHRIKHEEKKTTWYYNYRCNNRGQKCRNFAVLFDDARFVKADCNDQGRY